MTRGGRKGGNNYKAGEQAQNTQTRSGKNIRDIMWMKKKPNRAERKGFQEAGGMKYTKSRRPLGQRHKCKQLRRGGKSK